MDEKELIALLRLQITPGVGPLSGRKLIGYFRRASAVFEQSEEALLKVPGIGKGMVRNLLSRKSWRLAAREFEMIQEHGLRCLGLGAPEYPALLGECEDAPLVLFLKGAFSFDKKRFISIVGTRNMTSRGRSFCEEFLRDLAPYGPVVVSGLAYGVDICAHRAALANGLQTLACLGHGLDLVYPQAHARYLPGMQGQGGLLSEFWLGTPPEPMNFVRRNRIIAGVSEATVVVESALKGGSLITADLAFGYNREVFAVPGRPADVWSQGCNLLIRDQKAQLLDCADTFVKALNWNAEIDQNHARDALRPGLEGLEGEEKKVAGFLEGRGEQLLDDIALGCRMPVRAVVTALFQLEMKGLVTSIPGKRYRLKGY